MKRTTALFPLLLASLAACSSSNDDVAPGDDTGAADTAAPDTAVADTGARDTAAPDTATPDSSAKDSSATDSTADAADSTADTADTRADTGPTGLAKVGHVVVIYLENHSFDNLYGEFAGSENLASAAAKIKQVDATGTAYDKLPQVAAVTAAGVPADLPNQPWRIDSYIAADKDTPVDLVHRYYQEQMQINGGKMDSFVAVSDAKGLSFGYYHTDLLPLAALAKSYTLCDHFFHSAFGGSFLNHIWLVAAASPTFPGAPDAMKAVLDGSGKMTTDGAVTPDGYVVNTAFTVNAPHPSTVAAANLVPNQTMPTIGDRLTDKGVDWAWYSGGWDDALAGTSAASDQFQYHHQPFAYFEKYKDGTAAKTAHLKDEKDLVAAIAAGTLPPVTFWKPVGIDNEHPKYADVLTGEKHVEAMIDSIRKSSLWKDTVIIVTYDEHGGFWDHVAPPAGDKWGPGSRVPTIVISPFAKRGFVDSTVYETVSVLSFIESRFGLTALGTRDAAAKALTNVFDFTLTP